MEKTNLIVNCNTPEDCCGPEPALYSIISTGERGGFSLVTRSRAHV